MESYFINEQCAMNASCRPDCQETFKSQSASLTCLLSGRLTD